MGFAAMQSGDMSGAREQFSYLSSIPGVTETIAARASQYLSLMSVDASANAPAPTDTTDIDPAEAYGASLGLVEIGMSSDFFVGNALPRGLAWEEGLLFARLGEAHSFQNMKLNLVGMIDVRVLVDSVT